MISIQRILCPTDLSQEADEALRYAVALTSACDAKLFLLYCKESNSHGNENGKPAGIAAPSLFLSSLAPHLGLNTFNELDWQGLTAENVDDVGKAIVDEATKQKIDLIVMRSRRRPRAALLLGSTAETVSRTATCPVLVTHPREREWVGFSSGEIDLHRIMLAHDFSANSAVALDYALLLAQEYRTELHLLHVLTNPEDKEIAYSVGGKNDTAYATAARKLNRAVPEEVSQWCQIRTEVRSGKSSEEVLAYAKEHEIDLICVGASGAKPSLCDLCGSNVDRILRKAPCPCW